MDGRTHNIPPPTDGLNTNKDITALGPREAYVLDNLIPRSGSVDLRRGTEEHATGLPEQAETLMEYSFGATEKLFAASNGKIYDVTSAGAVGAAAVSGLNNNRWQHVNFGAGGSNYLVACNGADTPVTYNGSSWGTVSFTGSGLTTSDLVHVNEFKKRLFFIESNTLSFWYLAVSSIAGTATEFNLDALCSKGGYLVAMGTWTRDGGDGMDDLAVFITSNGQAVIYQGSDPGDATDWSLVGIFDIPRPIGRRCVERVGAELLIVTNAGYFALSTVLPTGGSNNRSAISNKISGSVEDSARLRSTTFGWQPILYPDAALLIVNVPAGANKYHQHVLNTNTGAWCRFTGINAKCWAMHSGTPYCAVGTKILKADTGYDDDGADINFVCKHAFSDLGNELQKLFTQARPVLLLKGALTIKIGVYTDFRDYGTLDEYEVSTGGNTPWGSPWGSPWSVGDSVYREWLALAGNGYNASLVIQGAANGQVVSLRGAKIMYQLGGV